MIIKIPFVSNNEIVLFKALVKNDGQDENLVIQMSESITHLWFVAALLLQIRVLVSSNMTLKNLQSQDSIRTYNSLLIAKNPSLNPILCWVAIRKSTREGRFRKCNDPSQAIWTSYTDLVFDRGGPASAKGTPDFNNDPQRNRYLRGLINSYIGELQTQTLITKRAPKWSNQLQTIKDMNIDMFWENLPHLEFLKDIKTQNQQQFKETILGLLTQENLHFQDSIQLKEQTTPIEQWLGITRELVPSFQEMIEEVPGTGKNKTKAQKSLNILLGNLDNEK